MARPAAIKRIVPTSFLGDNEPAHDNEHQRPSCIAHETSVVLIGDKLPDISSPTQTFRATSRVV
jgi:hypothetical protein